MRKLGSGDSVSPSTSPIRSLRVVVPAHNLRASGGLSVGRNVVSSLSRVRPGHSYLMFLPAGVGYEELPKPPAAEIRYVERRGGWPGQFLFESRELPRLVRDFRPDRIWALGNFGLRNVTCPQAVLVHKPHYIYGPEFQRREVRRYRWLNAVGRRRLRRSLPFTQLVFCQTKTACDRFRATFGFAGRTAIMPNAVSRMTLEGDSTARPAVFERLTGRFVLFCLTKYYAHKNLELLDRMFRECGVGLEDVTILLTIGAADHPLAKRFIAGLDDDSVRDRLVNVGAITQQELTAYFRHCSGLILPTLLESFSGTYLEAMQFDRPILTSDLDFAHDVCGPAARYFDPHDPRAVCAAILELKGSSTKREELVAAGRTRMTSFFRDWDSVVSDAMTEIEELSK